MLDKSSLATLSEREKNTMTLLLTAAQSSASVRIGFPRIS